MNVCRTRCRGRRSARYQADANRIEFGVHDHQLVDQASQHLPPGAGAWKPELPGLVVVGGIADFNSAAARKKLFLADELGRFDFDAWLSRRAGEELLKPCSVEWIEARGLDLCQFGVEPGREVYRAGLAPAVAAAAIVWPGEAGADQHTSDIASIGIDIGKGAAVAIGAGAPQRDLRASQQPLQFVPRLLCCTGLCSASRTATDLRRIKPKDADALPVDGDRVPVID